MSWIKCDSKVKAKCPFKIKCCGDEEGVYLEGSECDKFAQTVLAEPPTNADRIRSMSDEELAEALAILTKVDVCLNPNAMGWEDCPFSAFCSDCIEGSELEWLKQPVKEDA